MASVTDIAEAFDRLHSLIGTLGPKVHGRVCKRDFERFALAAGDLNPVYFDDDAARAAGYPAAVAPPLFLAAIVEWSAGPAIRELRRDGTGVGHDAWLPLDGLRMMGGGQELELLEPILDGTDFTAQPALEDVRLRDGRSGQLLLIRLRTDYRTAGGRALLVCRETLIARPPIESRSA